MNSLIIVGNGFDLSHGLPTSYNDFKKYLCTFEKEPIEIFPGYIYLDSLSELDQTKQTLFENMQKYINVEDLWNSLEAALGKLDFMQLEDDNTDFLLSYGSDEWRDSANHDYQFMIEEALDFATDIPKFFSSWINSISSSIPPKFTDSIKSENNLFLTFNYTDTLERTYNIPDNRICYIHGKALRGDPLVLGHHDDSYFKPTPKPIFNSEEEADQYYDDLDDEDFRIQEAHKVLAQYFKFTYKDTKQIIKYHQGFFSQLSDVASIYILGHSMSLIDFDYFKEVHNHVDKNCEWVITYYSCEDFDNAQKLIQTLNIGNFCRLIPVQNFYIK